ncbi:MAG: methionyl-tRNA formyltransferase [Anaerolineaceae bacterium]|nr:methionyl-tRNA formyltransferase [Anaerolineaceae bacterium]MDD4042991.1 methionyl-tRNA formyltransferase [Anaerolineaceae bacterium]MDD4578831.1 methionyl-tRNA formyltransferase [Anaerolineaceae bacterium]
MSVRVVFMGSPDFALPTLEELHRHYQVVGVVTQPDRPAGRGRKEQQSEVKKLALKLGLPIFQPQSLRKLSAVTRLAEWKPDLIVVAAYGQILPKAVLEMPTKGCINVHASLLPAWRGASPIQAAIVNGDEKSGVTIMLMDEGMDTGGILAQRSVPIRPGTTAPELSDQLAHLGARTLISILPSYLRGSLGAIPQDESRKSYAPKLTKHDGLLDFSLPAQVLLNQVNAYQPWPCAVYEWQGKRLKIIEAHVHPTFECDPRGRFVINGLPAVCTGDGLLVLDTVQPEGKKPMPGKAFLNGQPDWLENE